METPMLLLLLSVSLLDPSTSTVRSSSVPNPLLGVAPQDEKYYDRSSEFFRCRDVLKRLERSRVNDDFCDCPDGSDEPGTSACPDGRFYCRNVGHVATVLYSSRVNDGICDCCDGSDEYDGKMNCRNTCWEAGKAARDKLTKKIKTYQDGVTLRRKEVEQARQAYANDEAELSKLKNKEKILKGLVEQLKERKEQIEQEEEKQRLEREKEEKSIKEAEKEAELEKEEEEEEEEVENGNDKLVQDTDHDVIGNFEHSSGQGGEEVRENSEVENDANSSIKETATDEVDQVERNDEEPKDLSVDATGRQEESAAPENTEGLSKEELGRLVASRWTGESTGQKPGESNFLNDDEDDVLHKEDHGYDSEVNDGNDDDSDQGYDDDHDFEDHMDEDSSDVHGISGSSYGADSEDESILSDVTASSNPSWLEKIKKTARRLLNSVNLFQAPLNITDAARVRKEYDKSFTKLSELQSRISSLSQKLKHDFGPEKEFYFFYDRCFERKQNKYVYKVCPYKQATQTEGHSSTRLGRWEKFEESYRVMLFANGDRCWNGPDRSLKVRLRCGLENEIADIDEPSRCEYVAVLSMPNVCHEEKLKELQQKLDALNKDQPPNHDEL